VLRQALNMPPMVPPSRPRRHPYSTFEYEVDLKFCNGLPSLAAFDLLPIQEPESGRVELICPFCTRINSFVGLVPIWSHIFHQHKEKTNAERLEAIREKGKIWREHSAGKTHRGKKDPMMVKLAQAEKLDFNWEVVISWRLR
jgi:hypothetical protein